MGSEAADALIDDEGLTTAPDGHQMFFIRTTVNAAPLRRAGKVAAEKDLRVMWRKQLLENDGVEVAAPVVLWLKCERPSRCDNLHVHKHVTVTGYAKKR